MTTRIGIVSDVHSSPVPLQQALELFASEQVDDIICAGDIAGYFDTVTPTVELLAACACQSIVGNHDQHFLENTTAQDYPVAHEYLAGLPTTLSLDIEGKRILVVHANPPDEQHGGIKLLNTEGEVLTERTDLWCETLADLEYDVLIVGHTHQVYAEQIGDVFVVNPGSSVFNHSCMILSLPDLTVQTFALENLEVVKCWHFSMLRS